ncbi:response regulator transcription factor [Staphylococcus americanisciuri]|uniref:Response regulator SaeR n=1 Tax=Staphylococcus americanisciuri TaxID=2973940 RepID=A0ABT2F3A7_9STAP|nr:response regulator transcription factor [Staphylococcus americanisciuri]MCS4486921.1 response regulator transcription factor [Staphylococcus americanisciuri]
MSNIIYVEDDDRISSVVSEYLESFGYKLTIAHSFEEFCKYKSKKIDLILLDVMLPDINGIDICKKIRDNTNIPIIFVSALGLEDDIINALECGVDDYITKPFSLRQLKVKVDVHLRREKRTNYSKGTKLITGNLVINTEKKEIMVNGKVCEFTKKEYLIIEKLVRNKRQSISKELLFESIWGYNNESNISTVTEHIKKIRRKLLVSDPNMTYIQTKYGFGYLWEAKNEK